MGTDVDRTLIRFLMYLPATTSNSLYCFHASQRECHFKERQLFMCSVHLYEAGYLEDYTSCGPQSIHSNGPQINPYTCAYVGNCIIACTVHRPQPSSYISVHQTMTAHCISSCTQPLWLFSVKFFVLKKLDAGYAHAYLDWFLALNFTTKTNLQWLQKIFYAVALKLARLLELNPMRVVVPHCLGIEREIT